MHGEGGREIGTIEEEGVRTVRQSKRERDKVERYELGRV